MLASKLPVPSLCLALIAQTFGGCALIEPVSPDAELPEPEADAGPGAEPSANDIAAEALEAEPDEQAHATETPIAADATPLAVDGGLEPDNDAALLAPDGGITAASDTAASCEADWRCSPDEYCSRVRKLCRARCQGDTCLGPTISDTNDRLVSDGARVCFADDSEAPGSGDFALRIWDGVAPRATTLTRAREVRALLLDAQYCYFHAAGALRRAALSGSCVELLQEMAEPPSRIWSDQAFVAWSAAAGEFYRVATPQNARPERMEPGASAPSADNVYATSARAGERAIERHAEEGRLQATLGSPAAQATR